MAESGDDERATESDENERTTDSADGTAVTDSDGPPRVGLLLVAGLRAHRYYAAAAGAVLLAGIPAGWLLQEGGVALSTLPLPRPGSVLYPQQRSLLGIFGDGTELFSLLVVGAGTAGALTVVGLLTQGLLVGSFLGASAESLGVGYLALSLLPHGLFRAAAFVLAAAVSFRFVACGFAWAVGRRERFQYPVEWRQAGLVLAVAWLCLAVSALIEVAVTFRLLDLLC